MSGFIHDGYTRDDGYIAAAVPEDNGTRLYDALEFEYRPGARLEVLQLDADVRIALKNQDTDRTCAVKAEKIACEFVAKHLKSWSLKMADGNPVTINAISCERVHPFLFNRLYAIIRDERASDPKPLEDKPDEKGEAPPSDAAQVKN